MQHKTPKNHKKEERPVYKLDAPIRSNPNEQDWQFEEKKLKEKHRNQLR